MIPGTLCVAEEVFWGLRHVYDMAMGTVIRLGPGEPFIFLGNDNDEWASLMTAKGFIFVKTNVVEKYAKAYCDEHQCVKGDS
jgi:hypothetical protein